MRIWMLIAAILGAIALPTGASAAGPTGYCATPAVVGSVGAKQAVPAIDRATQSAIDDPLLRIVPVVQYACSNNCRRRCYSASQSCRASRRTCQRRLSACIRRCGC